MRREELADLIAFMAVAEERSFTRAAAKQGLSQSALSQKVRRLEDRLGMRLLSRTTRSVAPTKAGERIMQSLGPALVNLEESIADLTELQAKPAGTVRITSVEHATRSILRPALKKILHAYPDITLEIVDDYTVTDIVSGGYDAGIRIGEQIDKDMIAVRISPDVKMVVVGAPEYFDTYPRPRDPRQLLEHRCLNLWLPSTGTIFEWRFRGRSRTMNVRVNGPLVFNSIEQIERAALDGLGLACLPQDQVQHHIDAGHLVSVLDGKTQSLPGYHLYYPHRRYASPAFRVLVETLRYRS